jgi:WD40 repeat protein
MKHKMFLIAAALVLLSTTNGHNLFAQFDPPLELLWEVQNIGESFDNFAVSPDESIFVSRRQNDSNSTIHIFDMANGTLLRQFLSPFCGSQMAFMPDSRHLVISDKSCLSDVLGINGKIQIIDLQTGIYTDSLDFPDTLKNGRANDISVSSDGKYLSVCVSKYPQLKANYILYNLKDKSIFTRVFVQNGNPFGSAFSLDSRYFLMN